MDQANESLYWVEVKPLITSELKSGNFVPVLEALYNFAKPFKFVIADVEDKNTSGRRLVRFFIHFQDEQTTKQMSNIIRAVLNVEVVGAKPPERQYLCNADLELAKNYALPIVSFQEKSDVNLIDRLVATVAGSGIAIEVLAQGDSKAAMGIQKYIYEKIYRKSGLSDVFFDQGIGLLSGIAVGSSAKKEKSEQTGKSQQHKNDPWTKEVVKNAEVKLHSFLFTCQIVIRGDSSEKAQAVRNVLPSAMNRFKTFKTEKEQNKSKNPLDKPSRYGLRNTVLSRLWWITPTCILLLTGLLGVFNPVRFASSSALTVDSVPIVFAVFSAVCLFIAFRKRQPIILSTQELAQIIGLPTASEKLPIALGQVPISRMQLGSEEQQADRERNNEVENEHNQKGRLPMVYRLPALGSGEEPS
jgi:hypothetical protein